MKLTNSVSRIDKTQSVAFQFTQNGTFDFAFEMDTNVENHIQPLFSDVWTGSIVWDAAVILAQVVLQVHFEQNPFNNCRMIEFGSGCGLLGKVFLNLEMENCELMLTDQKELVPLLRRNGQGVGNGIQVLMQEHTWGDALEYKDVDFIFVSDCINPIYGQSSWRNLVHSLLQCAKYDTIIYLSNEIRGENEAWNDFIQYAKTKNSVSCDLLYSENRVQVFKLRFLCT